MNKYALLLWRELGVALVLACLISWMFHYYFFKMPTDHLSKVAEFYNDLDFSELHMSETELMQVVRQGQGVDSHKLSVRSAFLRYILDSTSGGTFENYLETYQQGMWVIPPTETWRKVFSDHLATWEKAHQNSKLSKQVAPRPRVTGTVGGLILDYADTNSSMIGKGIDIVVSVTDETDLLQPAEYSWSMSGNISPPARMGYWERSKSFPKAAVLQLDFSREPEWYIPDRELGSIVITSPPIAGMEVLAIRHRSGSVGLIER